jgi:hypothetical protein
MVHVITHKLDARSTKRDRGYSEGVTEGAS